MHTILPFLTTRDGAFNDAVIRLMSEAFDAACTVPRKIRHRDREIAANRIIDEVTQGERGSDPAARPGIAA